MRIKMILTRVEHGVGLVPTRIDHKIVAVTGKVTSLELVPEHHEGDPGHPNAAYWAMSPGGQMRVNVAGPAAEADHDWQPGEAFWVDITPVLTSGPMPEAEPDSTPEPAPEPASDPIPDGPPEPIVVDGGSEAAPAQDQADAQEHE